MVVASRRRHALLALAGALGVLVLPLLHPGAWAHRGSALDSAQAVRAADAGGSAAAPEDHLRCPLCRGLAQGRTALASPGLALPDPTGPARAASCAALTAAPDDPERDPARARAPPLSA